MEGLCRAGLRTSRCVLSSPAFRYTPAIAFATSKGKVTPKKKETIVKSGRKSKTGKTPKAKAEPAKDKFEAILDKYLQPPEPKSDADALNISNEQRQRERQMASEYSRLMIQRHREEMTALNMQIELKLAAIAALPKDLQEAAMVPDLAPFPINRFAATLTPPIAGYVEETTKEAQRAATNLKSR